MLNLCLVCGGGIRAGYTAPEAACTCKKKQKERDDKKHEMLLAESRWLMSCGWEQIDVTTNQQGFIWKDPFGRGKYPQHIAIEMQKRNDSIPGEQRKTDMGVRYKKLRAELERREKTHQPVADIRDDMQRLLDGMMGAGASTPA